MKRKLGRSYSRGGWTTVGGGLELLSANGRFRFTCRRPKWAPRVQWNYQLLAQLPKTGYPAGAIRVTRQRLRRRIPRPSKTAIRQ